jgi:hypothetical protein
LSCFSLKRAEMAAGAERYWKILPPLPAMISQFHPILANLVSTMQTKVFQVSCVAGIPLDRAPQTPIKKVTVYLPTRRFLSQVLAEKRGQAAVIFLVPGPAPQRVSRKARFWAKHLTMTPTVSLFCARHHMMQKADAARSGIISRRSCLGSECPAGRTRV